MSSLSRLKTINERIQNELCMKTIDSLSEQSLLSTYKNTSSVKKKIDTLQSILSSHNVDINTQQSIIDEYMPHLIPAGTKGAIKGNRFNQIVKEHIENLHLDDQHYEVCFEKKHDTHITCEIPDWYIYCKKKQRILIGMNQLDLWNGGAQLNRGMKYLMNNEHNTEKSKLLCVVCNSIQLKSTDNKAFQLFDEGFKQNTLCYLKNLENIICDYFGM